MSATEERGFSLYTSLIGTKRQLVLYKQGQTKSFFSATDSKPVVEFGWLGLVKSQSSESQFSNLVTKEFDPIDALCKFGK